MPVRPPGHPRGDQRWSTFLRNHATAILACDFFVAVTATFRMLYVFVVIEHSKRRLAHINVTAHPNADWTLQQLREVIGNGGGHRYLIHDRDRIFAKHLDDSIRALGVEVLRSPVASPKTTVECPSEKKNPMPSGRLPCWRKDRVVLSIAAMWSASKAWRNPKV